MAVNNRNVNATASPWLGNKVAKPAPIVPAPTPATRLTAAESGMLIQHPADGSGP